MKEINEKMHLQLLDFNSTKREQWIQERRPFSVLFELTSNCNMNCIHCYLQNCHVMDYLSYEDIIKIIDILYEKGIIFLTFTGGEIFARKDFIDIYLYAKKKGFLVELFTNASLINNEHIDTLKEYPPLLVDVSLYGDDEKTYYDITRVKGAFSRVVSNCKKMVNAGIRVALKSPILKPTVEKIGGMERIAIELGVPFVFSFDITPTIDKSMQPCNYQVDFETSLRYEFQNYYEQVARGALKIGELDKKAIDELSKCEYVYSCNVAQNSFVIDYKGNILPCMKLRHKGRKLLDNDFDNLWCEFEQYSNIKASDSYKCRKCESRYFCDICPAEMDLIYGDAEMRPSDVCLPAEIRKKFYCREITFEEAVSEVNSKKRKEQNYEVCKASSKENGSASKSQ